MDTRNAPQKLAKSKRFWTGITGLLVIVISAFIPQLENHLIAIQQSIVAIILTMIAGYSAEDAARQFAQRRLPLAIDFPAHTSLVTDTSEGRAENDQSGAEHPYS